MVTKNLEISYLLDFYGDVLTEKQRDVMEQYYNDDLSLSEIADNFGITRQGVRDVLVRAENTLEELEAKTGIVRRFLVVRSGLNTIEEAAKRIETLNQGALNSSELAGLVKTIQETVDTLKE